MILDMIGARRNARCVGAATACLVALALFVGPLCAGMCAGSICVARAAIQMKEPAAMGWHMEKGHRFRCGILADPAVQQRRALRLPASRIFC